jgi:hypothetical protein
LGAHYGGILASAGTALIPALAAAVTAEVDIRPGDPTNFIDTESSYTSVHVAVLSTSIADGDTQDFNASEVNPTTVRFGAAAPDQNFWNVLKDVDADGDTDLDLVFRIPDTGILCEESAAVLTGELNDTTSFSGSGTITTPDCPACHSFDDGYRDVIEETFFVREGHNLQVMEPAAQGFQLLQTGASNGALALNSDGSFSYTPDDNFFGLDDFEYLDAGNQLRDVTISVIADVVGEVKFFVDAKSDFDVWTSSPPNSQKAFMRANYYRMQTYSSYFDARLAWYPNAWVYKDAYALKPHWSVTIQNPDWILKDASGNQLYIPFGCDGVSCPQYAADFGNPAFRNWWLDSLADRLSRGYIGVWIDDVNLAWRVGDANGDFVQPIDPRTGAEMTWTDYQRYFAEFMEAVRVQFPDVEIAHNVIWSAGAAEWNDQYIRRQILAADYINLERGVTDGLSGGGGTFGFESFLGYVDWVHSLGRNVILDDDDSVTATERDLELAVYFLINNGNDLIGADGDRGRMNPLNFWEGYNTYLGDALGDRYIEDSLFRRDFECGVTVVNQPDEPARTISFNQSMTDLEGNPVNSVTLNGGEGEVLVKSCD